MDGSSLWMGMTIESIASRISSVAKPAAYGCGRGKKRGESCTSDSAQPHASAWGHFGSRTSPKLTQLGAEPHGAISAPLFAVSPAIMELHTKLGKSSHFQRLA